MTKIVKDERYPTYIIVPPTYPNDADIYLSDAEMDRIFKAEEEYEACQQLLEERYNGALQRTEK